MLKRLFAFLTARHAARSRPAPLAADIRVDAVGLFDRLDAQEHAIRWDEVDVVLIHWDENPWGDPQFGAYCDTDWVLRGRGLAVSVGESSNADNAKVLMAAMQAHLTGFAFDHAAFTKGDAHRLFDLAGGQIVVWERAGVPATSTSGP